MKIHPLWTVCIFVRVLLILILRKINHKKTIGLIVLLLIGSGFLYKYFTGSNNEYQIRKVFWHETRIVHGLLYIMAAYFLLVGNINMMSLILVLDIVMSFLYRIFWNK